MLDIKKQALDGLIRHYLVILGAAELGLQATPGEVRAGNPQDTGLPDRRNISIWAYKAVLFQNRLTPEDFEKQMADDITLSKTQAFITGQAVVTEDEIQSYYNFDNDRIKLAYMLFDPPSFKDKVKVEDAALKAFYKKNQNKIHGTREA